MKKEVPAGAKIISFVYYVWATFAFLAAFVFLIGFSDFIFTFPFLGLFSLLSSEFFIVMSIFLFGIGTITLLVAHGLWNGQNWARIFAIVISSVKVLGTLTLITRGFVVDNVISFGINLLIIIYLISSGSVKKSFR
jgi:hypothetical protein